MKQAEAISGTTQPHAAARPWAVRQADNGSGERTLAGYLAQRKLDQVVRFPAWHDDRLNRELCAGRFEGVIFADMDALWEGVWKGHAQVDRWLAAGVRIEVADSLLPPAELETVVAAVYASWSAWQQRTRRRQTLAAAIACTLAVAAMAAMIWVIPPVS